MLMCVLFSGCGSKIDESMFDNGAQTEVALLSSVGEAEFDTYDNSEGRLVKLSAAPQEGAEKAPGNQAEKEINLLWVEIVISIACVALTIANAVYAYKHHKPAKKSKDESLNSVVPVIPVVLTVFTPIGIIPAIVILGVMTLASGGFLIGQIVINLKRKSGQQDLPAESASQSKDAFADTSDEETAELAEANDKYSDGTDVFTELKNEDGSDLEEHKYISPENIIILDEDEEAQPEEGGTPIITLSAEGDAEGDDEESEDDDQSEKNVFSDHGLRIYVSYNYSFEAKLRMATSGLRHMYHVLSEYLKSFKLNYRRSWKGERYYLKGKTYARLMFRGKTLCICIAIDPKSLDGSKYRCEDVSGVKKYAAVPCMIRLRNGRSFKNSLELIQMMLESAEIPQAYTPEDTFIAAQPESREALIELGLIKVLATDDHGDYLGSEEEIKSGKIDLSSGGMPIMNAITAEEAHKISDEIAEGFIHIETEQSLGDESGRRKGIVNIDSISAAFNEGDTVTLDELKARGLVPKNISYVKVLARGLLDKSLTVKAHDFSLDAIKMIVIAGGDAIELKKA